MALKEITDLNEKLSVNPTDYLHVKQGTEDVRVKPDVLFDLHKLEVNPHNITKTTVGLANVTDDAQLAIANNLSDVASASTARTNLDVYSKAETNTEISNHSSLTNNPHAVTKGQVGLGNVNNYVISHDPNEDVQTKYASIAAVNDVQEQVNTLSTGVLPSGTIVMWSGGSIPAGWNICDGTNGTPNLVNKFIRGGDVGTVGNTGGQDSVAHTHSGNVAGHTISLDEMPQHQHWTSWGQNNPGKYGDNGVNNNPGAKDLDNNNFEYKTSGVIGHSYTPESVTKNNPHSHGLTVDDSGYLDNKPEYYTLIFIQKI